MRANLNRAQRWAQCIFLLPSPIATLVAASAFESTWDARLLTLAMRSQAKLVTMSDVEKTVVSVLPLINVQIDTLDASSLRSRLRRVCTGHNGTARIAYSLTGLLVLQPSQLRWYFRLRQTMQAALLPSGQLRVLSTKIHSSLLARSTAARYIGLHARVEPDMDSWRPAVYHGAALPNVSTILSFLRVSNVSGRAGTPVLYVACALRGAALEHALAPLRQDFQVVTK